MPARLCLMCNAPLNKNGDCETQYCIYNPDEDTKAHESEFEYVEGIGDTPTDTDAPDWGNLSPEEMQELLDGDSDPTPSEIDELANEGKGQREDSDAEQQPEKDKLDGGINQDADDADDRMGDGGSEAEAEDEAGGDEGDMDTSDVEGEGEDETHAENDPEDEKGQLDTTEDLPEQKSDEKQLSDEDGDEPSDDAQDLPEDEGGDDEESGYRDDPEEDGLPPRPQGCNGDCKPSDDPGGDSEPCPHCTAKQFREQMEQEGKEQLPEEEMESEWQDFLDNWHTEAEENDAIEEGHENDEPDAEPEQNEGGGQGGGEGDGDAEPDEDYVPDPEDDDLPPRPQGCSGNCAENEDPDGDGEPCPHCTAKRFKQDMRDQKEEREQDGIDHDNVPTPEELAELFQQMLDDQRDKIKEKKSEREELIARVNEARDDFTVNVFEYLAAMSDEKLTGMFSAEELADFGDVAENNNAHTAAGRLRNLAEKMNNEEPPEDEISDDTEDETDEDHEQNEAEICPTCKGSGYKDYDPEEQKEVCPDCDGSGETKPEEQKPKRPDFKRMAKDLTITQEKRFDNLIQRLQKKVEGTFGNTAEETYLMPKTEGQFQGEDVSQAIQVRSRGVLYWITLSAAKAPEDD